MKELFKSEDSIVLELSGEELKRRFFGYGEYLKAVLSVDCEQTYTLIETTKYEFKHIDELHKNWFKYRNSKGESFFGSIPDERIQIQSYWRAHGLPEFKTEANMELNRQLYEEIGKEIPAILKTKEEKTQEVTKKIIDDKGGWVKSIKSSLGSSAVVIGNKGSVFVVRYWHNVRKTVHAIYDISKSETKPVEEVKRFTVEVKKKYGM